MEALTMRICPFCGVANAADNRVCHFCGRDLDSEEARQARARKLPAMVDGELIAVESDGQREEIRERAERIKAEQAEAAAPTLFDLVEVAQ
jgi:predicted nucleic acid-binding Zn ribbon protein